MNGGFAGVSHLTLKHPTPHWGVRCDDSSRLDAVQLVAVAAVRTRTVSQRLPLRRLRQADTLHACPHPDCGRAIPALMWSCFEHWQALPPVIRQGIWAATRSAGPGSLQVQNAEERAFALWGTIERELRELTAGDPVLPTSSAEPPRSIA
jgi:hypothetical protein